MMALLLLLAGSTLLGVVLLTRWIDSQNWPSSLVAFQLHIPGTVTTADVGRWLGRVQVITSSPAWYLLSNQPVALEIRATAGEITHTLLIPDRLRGSILASLHAALPTVRVTEVPGYLQTRPRCLAAAEAALSHPLRPLAIERAVETSQHLLAALQPLRCPVALVSRHGCRVRNSPRHRAPGC
jgi:hypothetical protein